MIKDTNKGAQEMEYGQRFKSNIKELMDETLEAFERTGGKNAFAHIKYIIPTYTTCLM